MTWTININGHDGLEGDEKVAYEQGLTERAQAFVTELVALGGGTVTAAFTATNTAGTVILSTDPAIPHISLS